MNGGHVMVCSECDKPFEIRVEYMSEVSHCPYCGKAP